MSQTLTLIATVNAKAARPSEMLSSSVGRRQFVRLGVDRRHQNEDAEHTPPALMLRLYGSSKEVDLGNWCD